MSWVTHERGRVSVHAPEGSYAATKAEIVLEEAASAVEQLEQLLEPTQEQREQPTDVYLLDDPDQLTEAGTAEARAVLEAAMRGEVIVLALRPDEQSEPVTVQLTQMLVARWFGPEAVAAQPVVTGLIALVLGRIGIGPSLEEIRELAELGPVREDPSAAASFVDYLLRTYGTDTLRTYLATYDPVRGELAALAVYSEPLATVEEAWLQSRRRQVPTAVAARRLARQLLPRMRQNWWRELEVTGYTLLDTALAVAFPVLTGQFLNEMVTSDDPPTLEYAALLGGIFLLMTPVAMRRAYAGAVLSSNMAMGLQQDVFRRLLELPHSFHGRSNVGDLMARLGTDTERVRGAIESVLRSAIFTVFRGIVAAVVLFFISWQLALLAVLTAPLFWVGYLVFRSRLESASSQAQTFFGETSSSAHESLSAHPVIKAFGLEQSARAEYSARLRAFFGSIRRLVAIGSALDASSAAAMMLSQLVVLVYGGYLVNQEDLQVGFLVTFLATLPMLFEGSTALAGIGKTIEEASGSMDRVLEVLEEPLEVADRPGAVDAGPLSDEIRLENVTFGYEDDKPVLSDFNLTIPAGSNLAIVGPSGCGKSTVINLIMRFWDPQQGRVALDGHDLRDVTLSSLRDQVGIVFQDTFVFDTTLRENIAFARPGATDEEVAAAARAAQLEGYIAGLANGYDTVLGERGVRMSGGQRQRLAIARAVLRQPAILILDEATSALDPQTEADIQKTLGEAAAGRTTITITHRLRTAARAERIVVIDAGRIDAEGTHNELIAAGGLYRRMYDEQVASAVADESEAETVPA